MKGLRTLIYLRIQFEQTFNKLMQITKKLGMRRKTLQWFCSRQLLFSHLKHRRTETRRAPPFDGKIVERRKSLGEEKQKNIFRLIQFSRVRGE